MLSLLLACVEDGVVLEPVDSDPVPPDTDTAEPSAWSSFQENRPLAFAALGEPILECVARADTTDPVFDGCYDWHSAVHGHWALYVVSRQLGDPTWAEAAETSFTEEGLAAELGALEAGMPWELPYGYAWFLALARERRAWGEDGLDPLAAVVAEDLEAWIDGLSPERARAAALADDYDNLSWTILALYQWGDATGDSARVAAAQDAARALLLPLDEACPLEAELTDTDNFFPACLLRVRTLVEVLPADETAAWLDGFLPAEYALAPVTEIVSPHESGLNFSRPWGLWSIWVATGDTRWRDLYLDHVVWHLAHPDYWARNYDSYSHWVPQFGVYALALTVDEPGAEE